MNTSKEKKVDQEREYYNRITKMSSFFLYGMIWGLPLILVFFILYGSVGVLAILLVYCFFAVIYCGLWLYWEKKRQKIIWERQEAKQKEVDEYIENIRQQIKKELGR
jgi:hypothetical protein